MMNRMYAVGCLLAIASAANAAQKPAPLHRARENVYPAQAPFSYAATVDFLTGNRLYQRERLVVSSRYMHEADQWHSGLGFGVSSYRQRTQEYYISGDPPITWIYDPTDHTATPSPGSCMVALGVAAWRRGASQVRREYHVPAGFGFRRGLAVSPATVQLNIRGRSITQIEGVETLPDFTHPSPIYRKAGYATALGRPCDISLYKDALSHRKYWVDRQSHLALREVITNDPIPGSRMPAIPPTSMVVRSFRPLGNAQPASLRLPPGTTFVLPELFKNTRLPSGGRRQMMTGPLKWTGLDFELLMHGPPKGPGGGTSVRRAS